MDPYWSAMWDGPRAAHWVSQKTAARHRDLGGKLSRIPSGGPVQFDDPRLRREHELSVLGALAMWRTASTEQIGALTGFPAWASKPSHLPLAGQLLFRAGVIQRGLLGSARDEMPLVLRPETRGNFGRLSDLLSMRDLLAVTAGTPWGSGSQFDRHNLIATELGLRIAQWCPGAASVVGELLSRVKMMVPDIGAGNSRAGDLTIVRKDGLRIVVEITASTGQSAANKIERWAQALVEDKSGSLVVLFVETAHPDEANTTSNYLRNKILAAARSDIDMVAAKVLNRMFTVRWDDWFPEPGRVSPDFPVLPAVSLSGDGGRVDLLDPQSQGPGQVDRAEALTFLSASHGLLGVPYALRNPQRAGEIDAFATDLVRRASGLVDDFRPPAVRPNRRRAS